MAKTIAVIGVTGTQGGSVASHFHSLGWNVRGITRSTNTKSALSLASKGISLVTADLDNPTTLYDVFRDAHVIFAMTDFWAPYFSSFPSLSKVSERATGEYAMAIEIQRGKNIVHAVAETMREEGSVLERFVYSTLPSFKELSGGKYTYTYHFDAKAVVSAYLKEKTDLWERSSLLNMGFYTTNMLKYGGLMGAEKDKENGMLIYHTPASPSAIHPFVVPTDTGLFVDLLVRSPPKQNMLGVSEMASYIRFMEIWSDVTRLQSEVKEVSVRDADKAAPGGIGREAAESTATSAEFGWGNNLVMPQDLDKNFKATSLDDYIHNEEWTEFLNGL